jgi:hypothetical protein
VCRLCIIDTGSSNLPERDIEEIPADVHTIVGSGVVRIVLSRPHFGRRRDSA